MNWVSKAHRENKVHNLLNQALRDPQIQEAQKKQIDEARVKAFDCFLLISIDYLHRHCGYGKKRLLKYMGFVADQIKYIPDDTDYFKLLNEALEEETEINILKNTIK